MILWGCECRRRQCGTVPLARYLLCGYGVEDTPRRVGVSRVKTKRSLGDLW